MRWGCTTMADRRIVLMGLRGSGKSTVGAILARDLQRNFVDLDDRTLALLQKEHGVPTIAAAFETLGERVFREAESRALREVLHDPELANAVIALGGGTPTAPEAADLLRSCGAEMVYLRLPVSVLQERIRGEIDSRRPALLPGADPVGEISAVHERRDPLYRSLATIVIETDDSAEQVAAIIRDAIA